jgi:hypothetical protein
MRYGTKIVPKNLCAVSAITNSGFAISLAFKSFIKNSNGSVLATQKTSNIHRIGKQEADSGKLQEKIISKADDILISTLEFYFYEKNSEK